MIRPDLSVVTVSYNTAGLLRACLRSLEVEEQRSRAVMEIIVVDCGSTDGSAEVVAAEFPRVRLIAGRENLGFTRGNNRGIRVAAGRHLLLLNPDTEVCPGAIDLLVDHLDRHPDVGVVAPQLRFPDGTVQSSRRRFPDPPTMLIESTVLERWLGGSSLLRRFRVLDRPDDQVQDVDWAMGACLAVRGEAARAVGLFDERFFMYSEEVDLCRRIRAAGYRVVYLPAARVIHHEGKSSEQNLLARNLHFHESRLAYAAKHHGTAWSALLRLGVLGHFSFLAAEEAAKLALGHRRDLRRSRLAMLRRVLVALARGAPASLVGRR